MTTTTKQIILTVLFLTVANISAFCQYGESTYDNRVKTKLDALGLKYEITSKGNFKIIFELKSGRTQVVIINSNTYQYGNIEVREIYSPAIEFSSTTAMSQSNLFILLKQNANQKIGAWQIDEYTNTYTLNFSLRASANASQSNLDDLIRLATTNADEMEKQLSDEDKY